ncbi:MAG: hypothetical protein ACKO8Z_02920 [Prosthecobacter sp.]
MFENPFSPLNTFLYGLGLGGVFLVLSMLSHWKTQREFKRFKSHLTDKLDLDAKQIQDFNKERTRLSQEAENLRMQVSRLNERPDNKMQRELEIFARAEKHMVINAPGFAPAWEMAKSQALSQIENEERGLSFPQKIFRRLIGTTSTGQKAALPESAAAATQKAQTGTAAA